MYEYENQNINNEQQTYQYQDIPSGSPLPQPRPPKKKTGNAARIAKKAGAIALSAALFGGIASGTFLAVNYAAGYSPSVANAANTPDASVNQTDSTQQASSLLKATSSPDGQTASGALDVSSVASSVMPSIVSITNKSVQEAIREFHTGIIRYMMMQPVCAECFPGHICCG